MEVLYPHLLAWWWYVKSQSVIIVVSRCGDLVVVHVVAHILHIVVVDWLVVGVCKIVRVDILPPWLSACTWVHYRVW